MTSVFITEQIMIAEEWLAFLIGYWVLGIESCYWILANNKKKTTIEIQQLKIIRHD